MIVVMVTIVVVMVAVMVVTIAATKVKEINEVVKIVLEDADEQT